MALSIRERAARNLTTVAFNHAIEQGWIEPRFGGTIWHKLNNERVLYFDLDTPWGFPASAAIADNDHGKRGKASGEMTVSIAVVPGHRRNDRNGTLLFGDAQARAWFDTMPIAGMGSPMGEFRCKNYLLQQLIVRIVEPQGWRFFPNIGSHVPGSLSDSQREKLIRAAWRKEDQGVDR